MAGRGGGEGQTTETLPQLRARERRARVAKLVARRLTAREIAEVLSVTVRTVEKDIASIRVEMAEQLTSEGVIDVANRYLRASTERTRELWILYDQAKNGVRDPKYRPTPGDADAPSVKYLIEPDRKLALAILREMREVDRAELAALQSLGVVHRAPAQLAVWMRAQSALQSLPDTVLVALAQIEDPEAFRMELERHVGPETAAAILGELQPDGAGGALAPPAGKEVPADFSVSPAKRLRA